MTVVLDASAVLAMTRDEPGGDRVSALIDGATLPTVNLAEILGKYVDRGGDPREVPAWLDGLGCRFEPTSVRDAELATHIRRHERDRNGRVVLSLADRLCLAAGLRLALPVLTGDRAWAELGLDVDVQVIR